ncbi:PLP-dependent transferase [Myriangium duriaei CBS 260.36]|uniref:PLP-dependent transferase n=1 Tax=Myriangium duriaei CBS 260.36 TaxID=1168546 RepID=A0A9P4JAN6_9PEZI|nr:PLP-dependent transferase [Myriangium duriaei CBS 260.36]
MSLSQRAFEASQPNDGLLFWDVIQDLWDEESNPNGFVSLGHIHDNINLPLTAFTYGDGARGTRRLRNAICGFLTRQLKPVRPIDPAHIVVTNGCSSAIEHLAWALGNPGDIFLVGMPFYGTFLPDLTLRTSCRMTAVSFNGVDPLGDEAVPKYESAILDAFSAGQKVAGIVICHPHNPLGRCYPRRVIEDLMRVCQKYQIHLISDEIYALSTWSVPSQSDAVPFESALSINLDSLMDPSRLHVIWGMSKDFGANGIRIGAIVSQNNVPLHASLVSVALYSSSSSVADHLTANILEDDAWVDGYILENKKRLARHLEVVQTWAEVNDIPYMHGVNSAFFLWIDLGSAYQKRHPGKNISDMDAEVTSSLLRSKVFLASGKHFGAEQRGWFRIVFSQQRRILEEGLRRIVDALALMHRTET